MAEPGVAVTPEPLDEAPPHAHYAAPLSLTDVLAQLPPDVVDAGVWARTDNVPAFKLTSRAAWQLVHATLRRVKLGLKCWTGGASGGAASAAPGMAAALARYTAVDTLVARVV